MIFLIVLFILAIGGRLACSFVCPLGLIQELIFKIPFFKKYTSLPYEEYLKKIKYVVFAALLILIPLVFFPNQEKWQGIFFGLKIFGFTTVFLLSLLIFRPFCKYICPFGVFLGFFNKISPYRYKVEEQCNGCGVCGRKCKMGATPYRQPNSMECIRCGECIRKCPKKAIRKSR